MSQRWQVPLEEMSKWVADQAVKWSFPESLPAHLKFHIQTQRLYINNWPPDNLVEAEYASGAGDYFPLTTGEKLTADFYPDVCIQGDRHWGILAVTGPTFRAPTMIGRSPSGKVGAYRVIIGSRFLDKTWEIERKACGSSAPSDSDAESVTRGPSENMPTESVYSAPSVSSGASAHVQEAPQRPSSTNPHDMPAPKSDTAQNIVEDPSITINDSSDHEFIVQFFNERNALVRQRRWPACNSVKKLFGQAIVAGIVKPRSEGAVLEANLQGQKVRLMKDDDGDFDELSSIVEHILVLKQENNSMEGEAKLQIRVVEDD